MCGLFAIVGECASEVPPPFLEKSLAALTRRGPDARDIMRFDRCILGHTRLSIIDLVNGAQPMRDDEQDAAIVFNGEIYNYRELRRDLERKNHRFRTRSDTEVILKAYAEFGPDCVHRLDGMFAFALWDNRRWRMYVARDRFGKKPLYYARDRRDNIIVASEVKAIEALGVAAVLDPAAINDYLALKYIPPWRTAYRNVRAVLPANDAIVADGKMTTRQYWELARKPIRLPYAEAKEETKRLLDEAVRKRMVGDVEVASFLSGGVDSTLVTSFAQRWCGRPIRTFSVGYGDDLDELPFAQQASDAIGTAHHPLRMTDRIEEELEKTLTYFDGPHADSSDCAQQYLSAFAAKHVKAVLSGDGADELFLGYAWYYQDANKRRPEQPGGGQSADPYARYLEAITIFPAAMRRRLLGDSTSATEDPWPRSAGATAGRGLDRMSAFDLSTYLPGQLLTKIDQAGMMHGLEVRCPFLDRELAEFVFSLPEEYKSGGAAGKIILKDILEETMPRKFVLRKKQGFGAPIRRWLEEPAMRRFVCDRLMSGARIYRHLNEGEVRQVVGDAYASRDAKASYRAWVLLCLEIWLARHT
jgi:asparagine synthase (glutamine-hydrolysing)